MAFKIEDLYLLAPELSLALVALVVMTVDLFVKQRVIVAGTALVGLLIPAGFTITHLITGTQGTAFSGMLIVDPFSTFFEIIFLLIAFVMILTSYNYVGKYVRADGEFYTLLLFSVVGMMLMAGTGELITIYIALELTSFPLYVMAGLIRGSGKSAEAAVKYVLLGAMSSAILLYGFALLYGLTGTTDLASMTTQIGENITTGNLLAVVAIVLVIAGFGFKISAVPFHMWAPDIYEGSPTPATAFFSVGSKAAGFAALIRVFMAGGLWQINPQDLTIVIVVLSIVAVLTMVLGNFVAAVQSNVKRMMAYSSIAQAGYILVGFIGSFAIPDRTEGNAALLFFILVYVVTNLGAFAGIIALANLTGGERLEDFKGLWRRAPLLSLCTAFCLLSLAGIPPFAGFLSKLVLFSAAWSLNLQWLVVVALLTSIVSLVYYGRIIKAMFFDEPVKKDHLSPPLSLSSALVFAAVALIILTVIAGLVLEAANLAASSLI